MSSAEADFIRNVISSPPEPPPPPPQQQPPLPPPPPQQQQEAKKRTPRYQWDVDRTRLAMSELLKYVTEHGFPKTSHLTGSHGSHPYDTIANVINNHGIPANGRSCDGRVVESRWDTLKKLCYEKSADVCARFIKHLPDIAHEHGLDPAELQECTSTMNVEGQLSTIKIDTTSRHYHILSDACSSRFSKETIQSIPLSEMVTWITSVMEHGYKVKSKRKSPASSASSARKMARVEDRQVLVDELGVSISDSDLSSPSRSASASPSPRIKPTAKPVPSPVSILSDKLSAYLDIQMSQQQHQQQQYQQVVQPVVKKKLSESYVSLNAFYEVELVPPESQDKLCDMGVKSLDDLHYVTCDDFVRAGISVIASRRLCAKVSRHEPD